MVSMPPPACVWLGRPLPQDNDSEEAIIGTVLVDRNAIDVARDLVRPDDFARLDLSTIFQTAIDLAGDGQPVDAVIVSGVLKGHGELELAATALALIDKAQPVVNLHAYCHLVTDAAKRRRIIALADRSFTEPFEDISPEIQSVVADVQSSTAGPRPSPTWFDDLTLPVAATWLVKGVLQADGLSVVYGPPGCGKSFLVADFAMHVALGWHWRGRNTLQGGVVYLSLEGTGSMRKRLVAFRQAHEGKIPGPVPFALMPGPVNFADASTDVPEVVRVVRSVEKGSGLPVRLVVVDTLARAMGGGDENSTRDMGAFVASLDRLRAETGAHVLVIHHSGKDATKGGRGSSALLGAVDTEIAVNRDDGARVSTAKVTKQRDGDEGEEFAFRLERVVLGTDEDGDPITSCVVVDAEPPAKRARQLPPAAKVVLEALQKAIIDHGTRPPAGTEKHIPAGHSLCPVPRWREYAFAAQVADTDKPDSKAKAFKRAVDRLQGAGIIGIWSDWVWLTDKPDKSGQA